MKTFDEIREAIFSDVFTNGSNTLRTLADIDCYAAKEYAKQWVHEFALQTFHHLDAIGYNDIITQLEPRIKDLIDAQ